MFPFFEYSNLESQRTQFLNPSQGNANLKNYKRGVNGRTRKMVCCYFYIEKLFYDRLFYIVLQCLVFM